MNFKTTLYTCGDELILYPKLCVAEKEICRIENRISKEIKKLPEIPKTHKMATAFENKILAANYKRGIKKMKKEASSSLLKKVICTFEYEFLDFSVLQEKKAVLIKPNKIFAIVNIKQKNKTTVYLEVLVPINNSPNSSSTSSQGWIISDNRVGINLKCML